MIVLRGIGRGPYLGAIVASGLARSNVGIIIPIPSSPDFSGSPYFSDERRISVTEKEDLEAIKLFLVFLNSI